MRLAILGIGPVCATGAGLEALKKGLMCTAGPPLLQEDAGVKTAAVPGVYYAAHLDGLERFIEPRLLRRLDKLTQMTLLSSYLCLEDAQITLENKERIGVVFGTGYGSLRTTFGFLDGVIDQGDEFASPTLFANSVHNAPAAQVSINLQLAGPCTTVTGFEHTALNVFRTAELWLSSGKVDYVLAGMGEEYCDVLGYAAAQLRKTPQAEYLPGEGFITFLLASSAVKSARYGYLERQEGNRLPHFLTEDLAALFIHNNRCRFAKQILDTLAGYKKPLVSHVPYYGRMMTGVGFEIALAALTLQEARLYPSPSLSNSLSKFYAESPDWNKDSLTFNAGAYLGCLDIKGRPEEEEIYDFYTINL